MTLEFNSRRFASILLFLSLLSGAHAAVFTLTINVTGSGAVSRNPTNANYPEGSVVVLTATPSSNWTFAGWSGDATGNANPLNVTMNSNKTINARFEALPVYTLALVTNGLGAIAVNPPTNSFSSNSTVQLTAAPAAGWLFGNWSGDASGSTNPLSVVMSSNKNIAANFVQPPQITFQPQNEIVLAGQTASFSVVATGSPPLIYYWRFNGAPILQLSQPMLVLTNVQTTQAGLYSVLVSNAYGTAISSNALLDVIGGCVGSNIVNDCSETALRAAIARGGTVRLCCNGTITLTNTITITNNVALDASGRSVVISGNNALRLFIVGTNASLSATNVVFADGTHRGTNGANGGLAQGQNPQPGEPGRGGAICNNGGAVLLVSCVFSNNQAIGGQGGSAGPAPGQSAFPGAAGRGGALYIGAGTTRVISCLFVANQVRGGNGGTGLTPSTGGSAPAAAGGFGEGAVVFIAAGQLAVEDTRFLSNMAMGGSPGLFGTPPEAAPPGAGRSGAIYVAGGTATANNCLFQTNQAVAPLVALPPSQGPVPNSARGGAVYVSGGSLTLDACVFVANAAIGASVPSNNTQVRPPPAHGGAVYAEGGNLQVAQSSFRGNFAQGGNAFRNSGTGEARGGAIFSGGQLLISRSTFSENLALSGNHSSANTDGSGGALYNAGTAILEESTFESNLAKGGDAAAFGTVSASYPGGHAFGGAIFNSGTLAVTNCTLAVNRSQGGMHSGSCCGASGSAYGGGLHSSTGSVQLMNVTIASNSVSPGALGTVNNGGLAVGANLSSTNGTVTLRNSLLAYGGTNGNAWGTILDGGFNVSSDGSISLNSGSSFSFTDPKLGPLQVNGGPTPTMALASGSPAIDFGGTNGAPATDQRGFSRPFGNGVDIGAFEVQPSGPVLNATLGASNSLTISFAAEAGVRYEIHSSSNFLSWLLVETIGPAGTNRMVTRNYSTVGTAAQFYRLALPVP